MLRRRGWYDNSGKSRLSFTAVAVLLLLLVVSSLCKLGLGGVTVEKEEDIERRRFLCWILGGCTIVG